jgi:hypothetical protein
MTQILAAIFNSITLVLLGILGALEVSKRPRKRRLILKKTLWGGLMGSVVFSLAFQFAAALHQQTCNNDLVLRYEDKFDEQMTGERAQAAEAITVFLKTGTWKAVANQDDIDSLEEVLAFFDELGFYWKNGEISTAVLYEHFYCDMRTYCQPTMEYIHDSQKTESVADWEYVEPLFKALTRIEAKRIGKDVKSCDWNNRTLQEY